MAWFAYTVSGRSIQAYSIQADGRLIHIGTPIPDYAFCIHAYADKLFVGGTHLGENPGGALSVYQINRDGTLTPKVKDYLLDEADTVVFLESVRPPSNRNEYFIFATFQNGIRSFKYNDNNATLETNGPALKEDIWKMQLDGAGRFLYVNRILELGEVFDVVSFFVSPSGTLQLWDQASVLGSVDSCLAVDPNGKFLYTGSIKDDDMRGCTIDFGKITPIKGDVRDYVTGIPSAMKILANGKILLVSTTRNPFTGNGENRVLSYSIDPKTGMLTALNDYKCESRVSALVTAMGDKYLYAPSYTEYGIDYYQIEKNGKLTSLGGISTNSVAESMVVVEV